MKSLQRCLIKMYADLTDIIPLSPFVRDEGLSIQQLYTPVSVEEVESKERNAADSSNNKQITSYHDLLYQGNELVKNVYMKGSAGRGKSTYCLRMLDDWINSRNKHDGGNDKTSRDLSDGEKDMLKFEFVFFVSLRHVDKLLTSVFEMICKELLCEHQRYRNTVIHALESMPERCLVIVDGLDEWSPTSGVCSKLRNPGLPDRDKLNRCPIFMTSRPWKLEMLRPAFHQSDKLTIIHGIGKNDVEQLVKNVLIHHCGIAEESDELPQKTNDFLKKSQNKRFIGLLQIPLIVTFFVSVWHEHGTLSDSLVQLYWSIIGCLVQKVGKELDTATTELNSITSDYWFDKFKLDDSLSKRIPLLQSLGEIAFESFVGKKTTLVFPKDELKQKIGEYQLNLSLEIGLICQSKVPGKKHAKHVSIIFFHKSMQEFLAAIWLVSDQESMIRFLKHCSTIDIIQAVSNIMSFVSGLDSEKYRQVCCHLSNFSNLEYANFIRKTMSDRMMHKYRPFSAVNELIYKLQCDCYQECARNTENLILSPILCAAVNENNLDISTRIFKSSKSCMLLVDIIICHTTRRILREIQELTALEFINISGISNHICVKLDISLATNHELKAIRIRLVHINTINLPVESIQTLTLESIDMSSECGLLQQLSCCTQLTCISIYRFFPALSDTGTGDIDLSNNHKLQTIKLTYMHIKNILLPVESLQTLTLKNINMSSECELLQQLSRCTQMTDISICISYSQEPYTCTGDIDLSNNHELQTIKLKRMNIQNILLLVKCLQKLTLRNINMSSECELSQQLSRCTQLTDISICISYSREPYTCTGDIDLSNKHKLQTIELKRMNIQKILLPVKCLEKLTLKDINMSSECELSQQLSRCTQLTDISICISYSQEPYTCTGDIELSNKHKIQTIKLKNMNIQKIFLPVESLQKLTLEDINMSSECELSQQLSRCTQLTDYSKENITHGN